MGFMPGTQPMTPPPDAGLSILQNTLFSAALTDGVKWFSFLSAMIRSNALTAKRKWPKKDFTSSDPSSASLCPPFGGFYYIPVIMRRTFLLCEISPRQGDLLPLSPGQLHAVLRKRTIQDAVQGVPAVVEHFLRSGQPDCLGYLCNIHIFW